MNRVSFLLLLSVFCFSFGAKADFLFPQKRIPNNQTLILDFSTETIYSQANLDPNGYYTDLTGWISLFNYKLDLVYAPASWFHVTPYAHAQTHIVYNNYVEYSPFRFTQAGLKFSHFIHASFITLSPEVDLSFPLDVQKGNVSRIVTNDEVIKVSPALYLHFALSDYFFPFAKIGYQYRQELSGLVLYQLGLMYQDNVWEIGVLGGGFSSAIPALNPNERKDVLERYNGGSLLYSAQPGTLGASGWIDLKLSKKTQLFCPFWSKFSRV